MEKRAFLEKYSFVSWIFVIIIAVTIFYMSSLTFRGVGVPSLASYFYHFLIFFWLSFFLAASLSQGKRPVLVLPAILLSLVYAVSDEFHQLFVPGRSCSFEDFLIDSAGILLASLIYLITINIRNKNFKEDYY